MGTTEIAFLKIDVEGADTWVLIGDQRLLEKKRIRCIWFEQNKPGMAQLGIGEDDAARFLKSVGYDVPRVGKDSAEVVNWVAYPAGNLVRIV